MVRDQSQFHELAIVRERGRRPIDERLRRLMDRLNRKAHHPGLPERGGRRTPFESQRPANRIPKRAAFADRHLGGHHRQRVLTPGCVDRQLVRTGLERGGHIEADEQRGRGGGEMHVQPPLEHDGIHHPKAGEQLLPGAGVQQLVGLNGPALCLTPVVGLRDPDRAVHFVFGRDKARGDEPRRDADHDAGADQPPKPT